MAYRLPNGATIAIEATSGSSLTVTGISNAFPAIATSVGHGLSVGDKIRINSGWTKLSGKFIRVGAVTTDTFALEGVDTTSITQYPAGSGAGNVVEVLTMVQIPQIVTVTTDGGEQQYTEFQFLEDSKQRRLPTVTSAAGLTLTVADDPLQPAYPILSAASDARSTKALQITLADSSLLLYTGTISMNKTPTLDVNEIMRYTVTLSLDNDPVRYVA